jgi:hypothetical protein
MEPDPVSKNKAKQTQNQNELQKTSITKTIIATKYSLFCAVTCQGKKILYP